MRGYAGRKSFKKNMDCPRYDKCLQKSNEPKTFHQARIAQENTICDRSDLRDNAFESADEVRTGIGIEKWEAIAKCGNQQDEGTDPNRYDGAP